MFKPNSLLRSLVPFLLFACVAASHARAQGGASTLTGLVTDADGRAVAGAVVLADEAESRPATAGSDGRFVLRGLPCRGLRIVVRCVGYEPEALRVDGCASGDVRVVLTARSALRAEVLVTATRHASEVARCPASADVIPREEITAARSLSLGDLLAERTGLAAVVDHGVGVQMQGLDPAYTLILVDGQPLIGRTAGTLDLGRVLMNDVERVEIVKGPTSSLYGSDALAGVVNVITGARADAPTLSIGARYGGHRDLGLTAGAATASGPVLLSFSAARLSSDGYDLDTATISPTVAPSVTWSAAPRVVWEIDGATALRMDLRVEASEQNAEDDLLDGSTTVRARARDVRTEWSLAPTLTHRLAGGTALALRLFGSRYSTLSELRDSDTLYSSARFDQLLYSAEGDFSVVPAANVVANGGAGYQIESVEAERITGGVRRRASGWAHAMADVDVLPRLGLSLAARYDVNADYGARLSPKAALAWRFREGGRVYASVGTGFKAPTVQQLYLDFTNPTVGYSVFGAMGLREGLARLLAEGQVRTLLLGSEGAPPLRAEHSIAFNLGGDVALLDWLRVRANAFRNDLHDMIETQAVAEKNNGQRVFSYFNLRAVVTQGAEIEARADLASGLSVAAGYQFLDAYETAALDEVRAGEITKVGATGRLRPVQPSEYGGLFNRSRHSGSVRAMLAVPTLGADIAVRLVLRGRYGYADRNGNGILDDEVEYAPAYGQLNATLNIRPMNALVLYAAGENLLDERSPYLPQFSGRLFTLGAEYRWR